MSGTRYPEITTLAPPDHIGVVRRIFTTSHGRYDFLNHVLSLRRDVGWRRATVAAMRFGRTNRFLDVATGTADLAIEAARRHPAITVTGIDFAAPMLAVGQPKVERAGLGGRISLAEGDATSLAFPDGSFDVAAVAFGLRNMPDRRGALAEMARVVVPGGQVMVLEMTFAPTPAFRPLYGFYLSWLLPRMARLFARDPATYFYLSDSIRHFPGPDALADLMRDAGLRDVSYRRLTFGTAYLHIGYAPGGR